MRRLGCSWPVALCPVVLGWLPFDRLPFDRLPFDRLPFDRLPFDRLPFDRLPFDRLPFDRLPFDRLPFARCGDESGRVVWQDGHTARPERGAAPGVAVLRPSDGPRTRLRAGTGIRANTPARGGTKQLKRAFFRSAFAAPAAPTTRINSDAR
jgi:hypothetical protein